MLWSSPVGALSGHTCSALWLGTDSEGVLEKDTMSRLPRLLHVTFLTETPSTLTSHGFPSLSVTVLSFPA